MKTDNALQLRIIIANSNRFHFFLKYAHFWLLISFPCGYQKELVLYIQVSNFLS